RVTTTESAIRVGGAATLTALEEAIEVEQRRAAARDGRPPLGDELSMIGKMLRVFASRQIRNRATLAGNLVTASPIGDMAPVLLALGAEVILASKREERTVPLDDFFLGYRKTALLADEILAATVIPRGRSAGSVRRIADSFKVSKRRELDISIVAAAFA